MGIMERIRERPVLGVTFDVVERYGNDRGGYLAGAVTFRAFLSLFPLLLLAFSVIGFVLAERPDLRQELAGGLAEQVPGLRVVLGSSIEALVNARAASGVIGVLGLLWTGLGATEAAGFAVSRIFRVRVVNPLWKQKLWSLGTTFGLGLLGLLGLAVVAIVGNLSVEGPAGIALRIAGPAVGLVLDLAFFLVAYRLLTQRNGPPFARLWRGALLAAIGWGVLKVVGTWYVARAVSSSTAIYGTLAGAIGILLLINLAAQLLLLGAELNAVALERSGHRFVDHGERIFVKEESAMGKVRQNGDRSTGELVRSIAADTATLVRKEVELARQEIVEGVTSKVRGAGVLGTAGVLGLIALVFLGITMGAALRIVMAAWLAWLLTAAAFFLLAGIAAAVGLKKLKGGGVAPEKAKESVKEDVRWARAQLKR